MSDPIEIYRAIQGRARSVGARTGRPVATDELLTRHLLESFLDRLGRTPHGDDFVLKGGILLAAYGVRRPTKDIDAEAINADVSPEHLRQVVTDLADVRANDGIEFDLGSMSVQEIRDEAEYPGLRSASRRGSRPGRGPRPGMSRPVTRSFRCRSA